MSVIDARDLLLLPTTVDCVEDCEIVAVAKRETKNAIRRHFVQRATLLQKNICTHHYIHSQLKIFGLFLMKK